MRLLNLIDEYTRKNLAVLPRRRWSLAQVIEVVANAMLEHGRPEHIRSDNDPEFVAKSLRQCTRWAEEQAEQLLAIPFIP